MHLPAHTYRTHTLEPREAAIIVTVRVVQVPRGGSMQSCGRTFVILEGSPFRASVGTR